MKNTPYLDQQRSMNSDILLRTNPDAHKSPNGRTRKELAAATKKPAMLSTVPDCTELSNVTLSVICDNIAARYKLCPSLIYTWLGSVLLSVNPYKHYPTLYDENAKMMYYDDPINSPPHIFAIASRSYRKMRNSKATQSIVLMGESGSGKTDAARFVVSYLGYASLRASSAGTEGRQRSVLIEELLLQAGKVLEAFGNAKTSSNDNSSRFGKLTSVNFDINTGSMENARVGVFLLGKSRVTSILPGEQSFHIFHSLLEYHAQQTNHISNGSLKHDNDLAGITLLSPSEYSYLKRVYNNRSSARTTVIPADLEFSRVQTYLTELGFSRAEQSTIWRNLAGVLLLGNLKFVAEPRKYEDSCAKIKSSETLKIASSLLGLPTGLEQALTQQRVKDGIRLLNVDKAQENRDGLARIIYERIFAYLVAKINMALENSQNNNKPGDTLKRNVDRRNGGFVANTAVINILDIYGFEKEHVNSFEQFCINYANEKLQSFFSSQLITRERELYAAEGILCDDDLLLMEPAFYKNTEAVIALFEGTPAGRLSVAATAKNALHSHVGAFMLLSDAATVPGTTNRDEYFSDALKNLQSQIKKPLHSHRSNSSDSTYRTYISRSSQEQRSFFVIDHTFMSIEYDVRGFVSQDRDNLTTDIHKLFLDSSASFTLVPPTSLNQSFSSSSSSSFFSASSTSAVPPAVNASGGLTFCSSLKSLLARLHHPDPVFFVRCLKPNDTKSPEEFRRVKVINQMNYSGLSHIIQIMKKGYPCRVDITTIVNWLQQLPPDSAIAKTWRRQTEQLASSCFNSKLTGMLSFLKGVSSVVGTTKVFFRSSNQCWMDDLLQMSSAELDRAWSKHRLQLLQGAIWVIRLCLRLIRSIPHITERQEAATRIQANRRYIVTERLFIYRIEGLELLQSLIRTALQNMRRTEEIKAARKLQREKDVEQGLTLSSMQSRETTTTLASGTPSTQEAISATASASSLLSTFEKNTSILTDDLRPSSPSVSTERLPQKSLPLHPTAVNPSSQNYPERTAVRPYAPTISIKRQPGRTSASSSALDGNWRTSGSATVPLPPPVQPCVIKGEVQRMIRQFTMNNNDEAAPDVASVDTHQSSRMLSSPDRNATMAAARSQSISSTKKLSSTSLTMLTMIPPLPLPAAYGRSTSTIGEAGQQPDWIPGVSVNRRRQRRRAAKKAAKFAFLNNANHATDMSRSNNYSSVSFQPGGKGGAGRRSEQFQQIHNGNSNNRNQSRQRSRKSNLSQPPRSKPHLRENSKCRKFEELTRSEATQNNSRREKQRRHSHAPPRVAHHREGSQKRKPAQDLYEIPHCRSKGVAESQMPLKQAEPRRKSKPRQSSQAPHKSHGRQQRNSVSQSRRSRSHHPPFTLSTAEESANRIERKINQQDYSGVSSAPRPPRPAGLPPLPPKQQKRKGSRTDIQKDEEEGSVVVKRDLLSEDLDRTHRRSRSRSRRRQ